MIEKLLLEIGGSVSGAVFRLWLQNSQVAREASAGVDSLIPRFVREGKEQRKMRRDFERVSEEIAERLEPFFRAEFGGVPENEKEAAGHEVRATLDQAPISDAALFAADLDPQALEAELRHGRPDVVGEAYLSPAGAAFYDQLLREVSNYVIEIRMRLPDFETEARRAMFRRETELRKLVVEVLDRLPPPGSTIEGEAAAFEAQYRRDVARRLDQLELFGVTTETRRPYSLSVAYLTLNASGRFESLIRDRASSEAAAEEDRVSLPVDAALGRCDRVLIRGEAGSGKSTLLRWLAVNSARGRFRDELSEWNDSVPFLLTLRSYVGRELPAVDEFAAVANQHIATPEGWARDCLRSGSAIVLVDGVDELPEEQRGVAHRWLTDLVAAYPDARYVVTSRPPAVGEDWLEVDGFECLGLEPMSFSATAVFIDQWHEAIADSAGELDVDVAERLGSELGKLASNLTRRVGETRAIRSLASSPLLCAMLCALNRDRRAQIPSDRIELYRIALEMLLERRDAERQVTTGVAHLGLREKEILLRVFALWLLNNGKSEASVDDLVTLVEERLKAMPRVDSGPERVVENLLLRSGLLRQPAEGRIDFVHRTFLEYLAAKEAVETRSVGMLIDRAHLDQWQEVVVLAAGLASLEMREELIAGLIKRGDREPRFKHRLHLLAVECLETSAELSPKLTKRVEGLLERLIPPRSLTEAKAIASAGDLATARLGTYAKGAKAAEAAACVRALSLIGGESALAQLEKFGPDRRVTVARELIRGWQEFPAEEHDYPGRVLRRSPLDHGHIEVHSPLELEGVRSMEKAKTLMVHGTGVRAPSSEWPWAALADHPALAQVDLYDLEGMTAVPPLLTKVPRLSTLELSAPTELVRITAGDLPNVERLAVTAAACLVDASGVEALRNLKELRLTGVGELRQLPRLPATVERVLVAGALVSDLAALDGSEALEHVSIRDCHHLVNVDAVARHPRLARLSIENSPAIADLSRIGALSQLRMLCLRNAGGLGRAEALGGCANLVELAVERSARLTDAGWLGALAGLRELSFAGCTNLGDLSGVELPELRSLHLVGTGIQNLDWVAGMPNLRALHIDGCIGIDDLSPLSGLRHLRRLSIGHCVRIEDVSPLLQLPELHWLDARGCSNELDLEVLEKETGVLVRSGPLPRLAFRSPVGVDWARFAT